MGTTTYNPHGTVTDSTGEQPVLGYAGEYTDGETGLVYLRARYYDPTTGQFLTRDPIAAMTREVYSYAGNNPINRVDPTGLEWWDPSDWSADDIWDATGGRVVSGVNDLCFESWQEAATCTAVVAGTVSLGAGTVAVLGGTTGLTGTAAAISTYSGYAAIGAQATLTLDDCARGVDGSCVINSASLALGGAGLAGAAGAGRLARHGSELAVPLATYGLAAGVGSFIFGFARVGRYIDGC